MLGDMRQHTNYCLLIVHRFRAIFSETHKIQIKIFMLKFYSIDNVGKSPKPTYLVFRQYFFNKR